MRLKFTFYLKSGKVFDTIVEDLTAEQFNVIIRTVKTSFKEGVSACLTLNYCVVNLSECAVVDWEVL